MRYKITPSDETLPWAGAELPIVRPLDMQMSDLAEALGALGWRLTDLEALTYRSRLAHLEQHAARTGQEYSGPPSEITGNDEIILSQLIGFATLRTGGFPVSWRQVCSMRLSDFTPMPDDPEDEAMLDTSDGAMAEESENADPQSPSKGSAPASDGATEPTPETTGPQ
ncbi:hypothetical protein LGT39_12415 [Demequina sp. TTPB684]|uniref:hypothetical protein n=1 Tax=unclassified Demequina TaxID=2620311 RepID=UPI001CF39DF5|nr:MULTISPECIES: hypothetical protein [unclassified Demequina]MCB2413648.1 hypothetical protein [Demequina sp. TTPB684]UPU87711.1 hypothetical protein LGT36_010670 [Demequina sp. TMPB413]